MKVISHKWLFLIVLALIIQISANFSDYKLAFKDNHFLMESILQVIEADLDNDQANEMVLAGKNYIDREVFIYWLTGDSELKPVIKWKSDNLFEERSIIWVTSGKFTSDQNQLLAFSNSQYYLYQFENNHVNLLKQENHSLKSLYIKGKDFDGKLLNVGAGDIDGDGFSEIVVARVGKITAKIYDGIIQIWKFQDGQIGLLAESELIGNIRGITAGDIDQDGRSEIFVEEGFKFGSGNLHILHYSENKLTESFCLNKAAKGPVYSMQISAFPQGLKLVTATGTGIINFFSWDNNALVLNGKEIKFDTELMSMAVCDLNKDKDPELVVVAYPQDFMILTKQ